MSIESEASTEMEIVKNKESRWREVRNSLRPYLDIADLWLAALDDLAINHLDYSTLALSAIRPHELSNEQRRDAKRLKDSLAESLTDKLSQLQPFHWELEYPDVFYRSDGQPLAPERIWI